MSGIVRVLADAAALYRAAAEEFVARTGDAVRARGVATVALAGGSTPRGLYALLASDADGYRPRVPWEQIHLFWGDERHVPPDHADSNFRMAHEALLARVPVPPSHVHRVRAEHPDAGRVAEEYEGEIRGFFTGRGLMDGAFPRFDLVLLGMGPDGHTASLFPGTAMLHETERIVRAPWVPRLNAHRITLTPPALNRAAAVVFLVAGEEKAETLRAVLEGERQPDAYPSQVIRPSSGELLWLVERAAAARLSQSVTAMTGAPEGSRRGDRP